MGSGNWTTSSYSTYVNNTRGMTLDNFANASLSTSQVYTSWSLDPMLNPKGVIRECCDSNEHPNTLPVILALDVTGSMGRAARAVAQQLNQIMTDVYATVKDVEFCTMAIGDLSYDDAPIQVSQFESDIRIADQLDKVYFEGGGGGNGWESYTAAWYFALNRTKLDCHKRGRKGIIITMGDEPLNPYLPASKLSQALGITVQADVDTKDLYKEVIEKFDIYHIGIDDSETSYERYERRGALQGWKDLLGDHYIVSNCDLLPKTIADIISNGSAGIATENLGTDSTTLNRDENGFITW